MNLLTIFEIASNHPNGDIRIVTCQFKDNGKYTSEMWLMRDGHRHKVMLSYDRSETFSGWKTEDEARKAMEGVRDRALEYYEKEVKGRRK